MGNLFLYGQTIEKDITDLYAKLVVNGPANTLIRVKSVSTDTVFENVSDANGKVVFDNMTAGYWDVTFGGVEYAPVRRIQIKTLEYSVSLDSFSSTINITYPVGSTCTVSNGSITYTAPDKTGTWSCAVPSTGTWTVKSTNSEQTDSTTVNVVSDGQVTRVTLRYFASTINIAYPVGSTCTVSNGSKTYTAPNTTGNWSCVVPSTGTWTVKCISGSLSKSTSVSVTEDAQSFDVTLEYDFSASINITYPVGSTCTLTNGSKTYTAPDKSGNWVCTVDAVGAFTVNCTNGQQTTTSTVNVTTNSQTYSVTLEYNFEATINITYPSGSTCSITNGTDTYKAYSTNGSWSRSVYSAGTWTVSCTDGEQTASSTVNVTTNGQIYSVELKYVTATISITYPVGSTCTVTNGSKIYTAPNTSGSWNCTVVGSGNWTITATYEGNTCSKVVAITTPGQNEYVALKYFSATISITYPVGSTCTVSKGSKSYTAPDTTGIWECTVTESGEYVISAILDDFSASTTVTITTDGQTESVKLAFFVAYIEITYPSGSTCTVSNGSKTYTAPNTTGMWSCDVPSTGTWTVKCTDGTKTATNTVTITKSGQSHNVNLKYASDTSMAIIIVTYPVGSTCSMIRNNNMYPIPDTSGTVEIKVAYTDTVTFSCTDGERTATGSVTVTEVGKTYYLELKYESQNDFSAIVNITYPVGSTCGLSDGIDLFIAPDKTGTWTFVASSPGVLEILCSTADGAKQANATVNVTDDGQTYDVNLEYTFRATINITYPVGSTCTVTDGSDTFTVSDMSGTWSCDVPSAGTWTVSCTDGTQTMTRTINVTTDGHTYSVTLEYLFRATINITYPVGSTCTVTDGSKTYTAPNTTGNWSCTVYNTGVWTVSCTDGEQNDSTVVNITSSGQTASASLRYFAVTLLVTYTPGTTCTVYNEDSSIVYEAPDTSGNWSCDIPSTGIWYVAVTDGFNKKTKTIYVTNSYDGVTASVTVELFEAYINVTYPKGSICKCTKGETTMTASDTTGTYKFAVTDSGEWLIECSLGNNTDSATVQITSNGQNENVTLTYPRLYLYDNGDQCITTTGGWVADIFDEYVYTGFAIADTIYTYVTSIVDGDGYAYAVTNNLVNITSHSKFVLVFNVRTIDHANASVNIGIFNSNKQPVASVSTTGMAKGEMSLELDISNLTGNQYPLIAARNTSIDLLEVYLE